MTDDSPVPRQLNYHQRSRMLEITFEGDERFEMSAEFLRVHSPSAEVRGHGPGQEVLQVGKAEVRIDQIEPVGNYAVCLHFDDGHNTGIYSWEELHHLGVNRDALWLRYVEQLEAAGQKR